MLRANLFSLLFLLAISCGGESKAKAKQVPIRIDRVDPDEGRPGTWVRVLGQGFGKRPIQITLGTLAVQASSWDVTSVTFLVPQVEPGATDFVVTDGHRVSNSLPFKVLPANEAPRLKSVSLGVAPFLSSRDIRATVGDATDPDGDLISFRYKWLVGGLEVPLDAPLLPHGMFSRGSTVQVSVTATDGENDGAPILSPLETITNSPPAVENVVIQGNRFDATESLFAEVSANDFDADPLLYTYSWQANGNTIITSSSPIIDAGIFQRDDVVRVWVTVYDGSATAASQSNPVLIANASPQLAAVEVTVTSRAADAQARVVSMDPDGDSLSYEYAWRVNGLSITTTTSPTLSSAYFYRGQSVSVAVVASDGYGGASTLNSNLAFVNNAAPFLTSASIAPEDYTTLDSLTVVAGTSSDLDGDTLSYSYQWFVNGLPWIGAVDPVLPGAVAVRGDVVFARVFAGDGVSSSAAVYSNAVTIINAAPAIGSASLGSGPFSRTSVLSAVTYGWADADGDAESFDITWWVDGFPLASTVGASLSGAWFVRGNTIAAVIRPTDGWSFGKSVTTPTISIGNEKPVLSWASLGAGPYSEGSDIAVVVGPATDIDDDTVSLNYTWFVDGVSVPTAIGATLPVAYFAAPATIAVRVIPTDGAAQGEPVWSNSIAISSGVPGPATITLNPSDLTLSPGIWVSLISPAIDPGGSAIEYAYQWYKDGEPQSFAASTTFVSSALYADRQSWSVVVTPHTPYASGPTAYSVREIRLTGAKDIAAGFKFACLVTTEGKVKCWGDNAKSQFGNGTFGNYSYVPTDVTGLTNVRTVVAGSDHACALTDSGAVKCWGDNYYGQIGNGYAVGYATTPSGVTGLSSGVAAIAAGGLNTCALSTAGGVKCWGWNVAGQVGNGAMGGNVLTPANVVGLTSGVSKVSVGNAHACALTNAGAEKCWGSNGSDQLGDNSGVNKSTPVTPSGHASGVSLVSAGFNNTCSVVYGVPKCWGLGSNMPFGGLDVSIPQDVYGLRDDVADIKIGFNHVCALLNDKSLKCWGAAAKNQAGYGGSESRLSIPTPLVELTGVERLSVGVEFSCALVKDSRVRCWGNNEAGQTGQGIAGDIVNKPVRTGTTDRQVASAAFGVQSACSLSVTGFVSCWGSLMLAGSGVLQGIAQSPLDVPGLGTITALASGFSHFCVLSAYGNVECWGVNGNSQLGSNWAPNTVMYDPGPVVLPSSAASIRVSNYTSCAITVEGNVYCWGDNTGNKISSLSGALVAMPQQILGFAESVSTVVMGMHHGCAIVASGKVQCWGLNSNGELGIGTINGLYNTPTDVLGLGTGITSLTAGDSHTCALTSSGAMKCWGRNFSGGLGRGLTPAYSGTVSDVAGLPEVVTSIAAGGDHSCAAVITGEMYCWGDNQFGQVGVGVTGGAFGTPQLVAVQGFVSEVFSGPYGSMAKTSDGALYGWGRNVSGNISGPMVVTWPPKYVIGY